MKTFVRFALIAGLALGAGSVQAQVTGQMFGTPVVDHYAGTLQLEGQRVRLWGVGMLAAGQPCYQGDAAWGCGDQGISVLTQIVQNQAVRCVVRDSYGDGSIGAQCFRQAPEGEEDLARLLVYNGWALDKPEISGGAYGADQAAAQQAQRGIWTSRFQSPEDWAANAQQYAAYPPPLPEPAYTIAPVPSATIEEPYYPGVVFLPPGFYDRHHYERPRWHARNIDDPFDDRRWRGYDRNGHNDNSDRHDRGDHNDHQPPAPQAAVPSPRPMPNGGGNTYEHLNGRIQQQHSDPHPAAIVNGGGNVFDNQTYRVQQQHSAGNAAMPSAHASPSAAPHDGSPDVRQGQHGKASAPNTTINRMPPVHAPVMAAPAPAPAAAPITRPGAATTAPHGDMHGAPSLENDRPHGP